LLAQLPVSLEGVYVDGWRFDKDFNRISHINGFLDEVRQKMLGWQGMILVKIQKRGLLLLTCSMHCITLFQKKKWTIS